MKKYFNINLDLDIEEKTEPIEKVYKNLSEGLSGEQIFIENDMLLDMKNVLDYSEKYYKNLNEENKEKILNKIILNKVNNEFQNKEYKIVKENFIKKIRNKKIRPLFNGTLIYKLKGLKKYYDDNETDKIKSKKFYINLKKIVEKIDEIILEETTRLTSLNKYLSLNPFTDEYVETEEEFTENYISIDDDDLIYLHGELVLKLSSSEPATLLVIISKNETFVNLINQLESDGKLKSEFNFLVDKLKFKYISDEEITEILSVDGELLKTFLAVLFHKSKNATKLFSNIPNSYSDKTDELADISADVDERERASRHTINSKDITVFINSVFIDIIKNITSTIDYPESLKKLMDKIIEFYSLGETFSGSHLIESIIVGECSAYATKSLKDLLQNTELSEENLLDYEISDENLTILKEFLQKNIELIKGYDEKSFFIKSDDTFYKKYMKYKSKYTNLKKRMFF